MVQLKMAIHPILLPWKSHGQRSLVGYSPCGHKELYTTERPHYLSFSQLYMTTGKTIALTRRTCVGKAMSLLLNMLSRLVITFLPRSKRLLISWLQSPSVVILEPKKIKSDTVYSFSPSICHKKWLDQMPLSQFFECWVLSQLFPLSPFTFIN